jgi:hypothetical protein
MRYQRGSTVRLFGLIVGCVVVMSAARDGLGQVRATGSGLVKVGEYAPDFNLPRLTITSEANGKPIGILREKDTVRLSSFRGKRPVCLIMSSYT